MKKTQQEISAIIEDYKADMPIIDIMEKHNIKKGMIYHYLQQEGVKVTRSSRQNPDYYGKYYEAHKEIQDKVLPLVKEIAEKYNLTEIKVIRAVIRISRKKFGFTTGREVMKNKIKELYINDGQEAGISGLFNKTD